MRAAMFVALCVGTMASGCVPDFGGGPMDGARDPSAVGTKPAYTADGTWGWFDDTTIPGKQWFNHVTGEIYNLLDAFGVAFDPEDDTQVATLLAPRVSGIISHATDTGVVTTPHTRTVVGAATSRATGAVSNVSGGEDNLTSGTASHIGGGQNNTASGINATVTGGAGCVASGDESHVAASINVENATDDSFGMGRNVGAAITPSGTNQNLSILLKANGGHIHAAGTLSMGGDVDAGTGALATIAGATGLISLNHDGPDACAFDTGTNWTVTKNIVSGLVTVVNNSNHALNTGDEMTVVLTNSLITSTSMVLVNTASNTIVRAVPVIVLPGSGAVTVTLRNIGPNGDVGATWGVALRFVVIGSL